MSFSKDENSDLAYENVGQEDKVNVEEAGINLGYVKKEHDVELEFEHKQYKIAVTFENVFVGSLTEQRNNKDSLIGFSDGNVVMETGSVKLENVKEENKNVIRRNIEQFNCNKCGGNYQGYCLNCSSLSHILNNVAPNLDPESVLNSTPTNMLEIREISRGCAVFALKALPKCIILGPFEGVAPIESTTGLQWKIKNKKFVNDQNGNWMKYIDSVANHASKNLDVFQIDGILYFETSRDVQEGEELLVCYGVEQEVLKTDNEEFYLVPVKKEEYPKVFACTLCCLGFRLESCLLEHKSKCAQADHGVNIEYFEIIQCDCCKVWLEKQEHLKSHMLHCLENYNRLSHSLPGYRPINTCNENKVRGCGEISSSIEIDTSHSTPSTETIDSKHSREIDRKDQKKHYFQGDNIRNQHSNTSEKDYKCSECSYQTNCKRYLKRHLNTHRGAKPYECDICKKRFTQKNSMKVHIINFHSNTSEKEYKCSECPYQTNRKDSLKSHLNTHNHIKPFECDICNKRFTLKSSMKKHIRDQHSDTSDKKYKCSDCSYQTNYKIHLKTHFNRHNDVKSFECDVCNKRFTQKSYLKNHIRNQHSNTSQKVYKCSKCCFQTNYKSSLKTHFNRHSDIKPFECDICKEEFALISFLKMHIRNQHSNTHDDIKPIECDICKKVFTLKSSLKKHIRNQHSNSSEKDYKCTECLYQTNLKDSLKKHLNTHNDIKPFECDICKKGFILKTYLKDHIKNQHSNTSEKDYKCSKCSYQTNYKSSLKTHLNTHTDIKPFECDICKKGFTVKCNLKMHIQNTHNDIKKFECDICKKRFIRKSYLNAHIQHEHSNTHNNIKPIECDICKKRYTQKSTLKLHIRNSHSNTIEKEYKCSECSYQTNYNSHLKQHLNTHSDIKAFACDICKKRFTQRSTLKKHIRNQHSNTNE